MALYEALGGEVVSKGPIQDNGIKYYSNNYSWLLYKIDIVSMLASKLFFVDEELIKKHFTTVVKKL